MSNIPSLEIEGRVATITLRRPQQANRLESADLLAIIAHINAVNANKDILALIIKAEGKYFCSGYNLNEVDAGGDGPHFQEAPNAIANARPVTIACMNGAAFGGATDLALSCDFRYGVKSAFIQVPAAKIGLHFYQSGLERYVSRLGLNNAKKVLLACAKIEAEELKQIGFLDEVYETIEETENSARELAKNIASFAPIAILGMKKHLNAIAIGKADFEEIAKDEKRADNSKDLLEGLAAMREKRAPVFKGE